MLAPDCDVAGQSAQPPPAATGTSLFLGGSPTAQGNVSRMDEVSIYSRALGAAEVQAIVQAGAAGKCAQ